MFFQWSQHWNMEDLTSYVTTVLDGGMSQLGTSADLGLQLFSSEMLTDPGQVTSAPPDFVYWGPLWIVVDGNYIPPLWGDCGQGDHIFKSLPSKCLCMLCLPDLLSYSGYHASSIFETCWNIPFLKKDTFGMSIIEIYCSWPTGSLTQQLYLKHSNQPAKANKIPQTKW